MTDLFQYIDVWKRVSEGKLVHYRCFQNLSTGKYSVQSADFHYDPPKPDQEAGLAEQFLRLFAEEAPDVRSGGFDSVELAIEHHDRDFKC
jgi:hypothetical protein